MKGHSMRRGLFVVITAVFIVVVIFFFALPFVVRPAFLQNLIRERVEARLGLTPSFQTYRVSLWPLPVLHFNVCKLTNSQERNALPVLEAERVSFRPSILPLFGGRVEFAQISLVNSKIRFPLRIFDKKLDKQLVLENISLNLWNVRSRNRVRYNLQGKMWSGIDNIRSKGEFQFDFDKFDLKDLFFESDFSIEKIKWQKWVEWFGVLPIDLLDGESSLMGRVKKSPGSKAFTIDGLGQVKNMVYQSKDKLTKSYPTDYDIQAQAEFDVEKGFVRLKDGILNAPFTKKIQVSGKFIYGTGVFEELLLKAESLRFDLLPLHILSFADIFPVNLGLSGESGLDCYVKGNLAELSINAHLDLTKNVVNYSTYFSKPADTPLILGWDLKLFLGRLLRGDFSINFDKASAKGSLVDFDLRSSTGEMTVMTNNFIVDGWQKYFPSIQNVEFTGGLKVFSSAKGNFKEISKLKCMNNLTFSDVNVKAANGALLEKLNGLIDFGPFEAEMKDVKFNMGGASFAMQGKMLRQVDATWLFQIDSEQFHMIKLIDQAEKISNAIQLFGKTKWNFLPIQNSLLEFLSYVY